MLASLSPFHLKIFSHFKAFLGLTINFGVFRNGFIFSLLHLREGSAEYSGKWLWDPVGMMKRAF